MLPGFHQVLNKYSPYPNFKTRMLRKCFSPLYFYALWMVHVCLLLMVNSKTRNLENYLVFTNTWTHKIWRNICVTAFFKWIKYSQNECFDSKQYQSDSENHQQQKWCTICKNRIHKNTLDGIWKHFFTLFILFYTFYTFLIFYILFHPFWCFFALCTVFLQIFINSIKCIFRNAVFARHGIV